MSPCVLSPPLPGKESLNVVAAANSFELLFFFCVCVRIIVFIPFWFPFSGAPGVVFAESEI